MEYYSIPTVINDNNKSFEYDFIDINTLSTIEKANYDLIPQILKLFDSSISPKQIFICEKMCSDPLDNSVGLFENDKNRIIIRRDQLSDRKEFLGTLIHELTHADSGFSDASLFFEHSLTERLGCLAEKVVEQTNSSFEAKKDSREKYIFVNIENTKDDELLKIANRESDSEHYETAKAIYIELIKRNPVNADAYYHFADTCMDCEEYEEGIKYINIALDLSPNNIDCLNTKAGLLFKLNQYEKSIKYCQIIEGIEETAYILHLHGLCLHKMGDIDMAIKYIKKAIELDSECNNYLESYCIMLFEKGNLDEVIKISSDYLNKITDNAHIYHIRASAYTNKGDYSLAIIDAEKAIELKPDNADYNRLQSALNMVVNGSINYVI